MHKMWIHSQGHFFMFLSTFAVFIFLMTRFVFASWSVCVADQAKVWSSEVEGKSPQWFLYCSQGGGGPNGMEETDGCHLSKSHPEPEKEAVTETSLCWAWIYCCPIQGRAHIGPLTTFQEIMRAMERLLSSGCFLSFKSTLALSCENITESWESCSIWNIHSKARSLCLPPTRRSPTLHLGRICFRPLVHEVSGPQCPTWPGLCPAHCPAPSWMGFFHPGANPNPILGPPFRLCSLSLCAGGLLWGGEPRGTKELNSGSAAHDLLLTHKPSHLHVTELITLN